MVVTRSAPAESAETAVALRDDDVLPDRCAWMLNLLNPSMTVSPREQKRNALC